MKSLPCPFCGSTKQEFYDLWYDGPHNLIYCECGAQAGEAEDEEGAIALWNTRSTVEVSQETSMECLPCPFCGGLEKEHYKQGRYFWLWCNCGAQGSHAPDEKSAIALWNNRICISNQLASQISTENK